MPNNADLLFEIGTEELPPKALLNLSLSLESNFNQGLLSNGIKFSSLVSFATPRRLAIKVLDCSFKQDDKSIVRRGPSLSASYSNEGQPSKAAEGFARSCGVSVSELSTIETDKGSWLTYTINQQGLEASKVLPDIAINALNKLPIPKRMRWGSYDFEFIRPVHWLVFLHGSTIIPCNIFGSSSNNITYGHRFHYPKGIILDDASEYESKLFSTGKVIASFSERRNKIEDGIKQASFSLNAKPDLDADLLNEVTALTEWPVPLSGSFDSRFLDIPQEALILSMKQHQKYFPLFDAQNILINTFITIANIESKDPDKIREGNERVIRPRLADAMFFWDQDGKSKLIDHLESLKSLVFHKKLGSIYDKTIRISNISNSIAKDISLDSDAVTRTALLSRCDLMTQMVYEFPEMQGTMAKYQSQRDGEPENISKALFEFYLPRYSGDELPSSKLGLALALADRIDTITAIFSINLQPTGDKDPFAIRRAAIAALRILKASGLEINLKELITYSIAQLTSPLENINLHDDIYSYLMDRLRGIYLDEGIPIESFNAVNATNPCTIIDFDHRIQSIIKFMASDHSIALASSNKRIKNILKDHSINSNAQVNNQLFNTAEEHILYNQLQESETELEKYIKTNDYGAFLEKLSQLRDPIDNFFDKVMVMDKDSRIRDNRIQLLSSIYNKFLTVADISYLHV